jgi:hypothetical protein
MRGHVLCGQMNLQKGNSGAVSLVQHLRDLLRTGQTKSFLIGVQEPPAGKGKVRILTDGQLFYNHQCERPRTAIYASRCSVLVEDDCDKICDGGWKERPYAWNPVG